MPSRIVFRAHGPVDVGAGEDAIAFVEAPIHRIAAGDANRRIRDGIGACRAIVQISAVAPHGARDALVVGHSGKIGRGVGIARARGLILRVVGRTKEIGDRHGDDTLGGDTARGLRIGNACLSKEVVLLDIRQDACQPAPTSVARPATTGAAWIAGAGVIRRAVARQHPEHIMVVVAAKGQLLDAIAAVGQRRRLAHPLHRGDQKRDQDCDDGDHHQQLD